MEPIRIPQDLGRLRELCSSHYRNRPALLRTLIAIIDDVEDEYGEQGTVTRSSDRMDQVLGPAFTAVLEVNVGPESPEEAAVAHVLAEWCRIGPNLERP
jgi:hypothetical protein